MAFKIDKKQYVDFKVYSVTRIKKGYGFRVMLVFDDESNTIQQKSGYKTKTLANKERDMVIAQLYNRTYVVYPNVKVDEYFLYWLEDLWKPNIKYGSYMAYRNAINNYIIPNLGGYKMTSLNQGHIRRMYKKVADQYHSVAKLVKTIMNTALNYAKDKGVVNVNVAKDVNLPKCVKYKKYKEIDIDARQTLTIEQCILLIKASKKTPIYMQIIFAILTGMRTSEVLGIKYTDIDYVNRRLYVERQLGVDTDKLDELKDRRSTQEIEVKTKSSKRWIGLTDILFEAILECRNDYAFNKEKYGNKFNDEQFIICSNKGKPRCRTSHNKYWKKLKEELNLPNITFHDLRHTFGTLLAKANFNLKAISELLGHASEIITHNVYIDKGEIIYDCLDTLNDYIAEVIDDSKENEYGYIYDYTTSDDIIYNKAIDDYIVKELNDIYRKEYKYGHIFDFANPSELYVDMIDKYITNNLHSIIYVDTYINDYADIETNKYVSTFLELNEIKV